MAEQEQTTPEPAVHPWPVEFLEEQLDPTYDEASLSMLPDDELQRYADLCTAEKVDEDCPGCLAAIVLVNRQIAETAAMADDPFSRVTDLDVEDFEPDAVSVAAPSDPDRLLALLDEMRDLVVPFFSPSHLATRRGLNGDDLAVLTIAARKWAQMTRAAGMDDVHLARVEEILRRVGG